MSKMEPLSDIAKDYLKDIDVLMEAQREFGEQMGRWWHDLLESHITPALSAEIQGDPHLWDNVKSPGQCNYRVSPNQVVYLDLQDPRSTGNPVYSLTLYVTSKPALKELVGQDKLKRRLDEVAKREKVGREAGLNWRDTELATEDVQIQGDDPKETARQVCDVAVRLFRLVAEHRRAAKQS